MRQCGCRSRETECQFNKASVVRGSDSVDTAPGRQSVSQQGFCCELTVWIRSRETECQFNKASVVSGSDTGRQSVSSTRLLL